MSNEIALWAEIKRLKGQFEDLKASIEVPSVARWQSWTPAPTGWAVLPTQTCYRYIEIGKACTLLIRQNNNGTSDANPTTLSLPIVAATVSLGAWVGFGAATDNNIGLTAPCLGYILSGGTVLTLCKDSAFSAFTTSGNKKIIALEITYEVP